MDWNGPKRTYENTETDLMGTETDWNGHPWVPKRTGTDFDSYRNELQWEPEKEEWGTSTSTNKCMIGIVTLYGLNNRKTSMYALVCM